MTYTDDVRTVSEKNENIKARIYEIGELRSKNKFVYSSGYKLRFRSNLATLIKISGVTTKVNHENSRYRPIFT